MKRVKNLGRPDESIDLPGITEDLIVEVGITVGVTVHAAARIMASGGANEIHVSDVVKLLAPSEFSFEDRGIQSLKGLPEPMHLHAYVE